MKKPKTQCFRSLKNKKIWYICIGGEVHRCESGEEGGARITWDDGTNPTLNWMKTHPKIFKKFFPGGQ